jgi:hypothetical protein
VENLSKHPRSQHQRLSQSYAFATYRESKKPPAPGLFFEVLLGFVIIIDPEEILLTERAWGGSVVVYSGLFYVLSWLATGLREEIRKSRSGGAKSNNAMQPTANSIVFMRETRMVLRLKARRLMASVSLEIELNSPST